MQALSFIHYQDDEYMNFIKTKPFEVAVWMLLIFSIIYIAREVSFIFMPLVVLIRLMFLPVFFSLILYYLLAPIVDWLEKKKIARPLAVIIVYAVLTLLVLIIFVTVGAAAYAQLLELIDLFPSYMEQAVNTVTSLEDTAMFQRFKGNGIISVTKIAESLSDILLNAVPGLQDNISTIMGIVVNTALVFVLLPILLFYILKDGKKLTCFLMRHIPDRYREQTVNIFKEIDHGLASFIQGQIIVSVSVGVLMYIGFLIIGIQHALVLALFAVVTNFIPYLGPFISTIPAVIVALFTSPLMALQVLIVIVVVQQIESLFITPQVMGKKLYIHPLTIIVLLLLVGSMAGLLGLIIIVPTFVIVKIIAVNLYGFLRKKTTA